MSSLMDSVSMKSFAFDKTELTTFKELFISSLRNTHIHAHIYKYNLWRNLWENCLPKMIRSEIEWWANRPKLAMEGNYRKSQWEKRFFSKTCKFFIRYGQWFEFNGLNLTLSNEIQSGHKLRLATPDTNKQINDQWCLFHLRIAMKAIYVKSKIFREKKKQMSCIISYFKWSIQWVFCLHNSRFINQNWRIIWC